ncbi:MAG: hypothetical protein IPJ94_24520 [Chloroflexi bacterium]|nr:hypothetical protein [Chloroflexota bacterium]
MGYNTYITLYFLQDNKPRCLFARNQELHLLSDLYQRPDAQFLILYGPAAHRQNRPGHRVGRGWPNSCLYWMASQTSATNQLRHFSQALFQFLNPTASITPTFSYPSWDAAFAEVARAATNRRLVVVLDEFTYVMQADPEAPSLLQKAWDHHLQDSQVFLS